MSRVRRVMANLRLRDGLVAAAVLVLVLATAWLAIGGALRPVAVEPAPMPEAGGVAALLEAYGVADPAVRAVDADPPVRAVKADAPLAVVAAALPADPAGVTAAGAPAVPAAAAGAVLPNRLPARVIGRPVPRTFFGLHLLSVGVHGAWPDVPFGVYRTWDGVYRWHTMRPQRGEWYGWSLEQLDGLAAQTAGRAEIMFTLAGGGPNGGFPTWLDPRARDRRAIHAEWRTYVRTLGQRLRGKVRYWEVWNEIDCTCFFDGPVDLLVELTDIAAAELRAIDSRNVILSAVNSEPDSRLFNEYLRLGGARNVDIVAWHVDTPPVPEQDTAKIRATRSMMARHGAGALPLWTTEGHTRSFAGARPADDAAILARHHLVLWSHGSENFSWYGWDVWDYGVYQGNAHWVTVTVQRDPRRKTAAGVAYGVLGDWLIGASMSALRIDGTRWEIEIERPGGYRGLIVWHAEGAPHRIAVPAGATRVRSLDGRSRGVSAGAAYATTTSPVLFDR
jgi:hypothetical protein